MSYLKMVSMLSAAVEGNRLSFSFRSFIADSHRASV
jgi:hypothetical protein